MTDLYDLDLSTFQYTCEQAILAVEHDGTRNDVEGELGEPLSMVLDALADCADERGLDQLAKRLDDAYGDLTRNDR